MAASPGTPSRSRSAGRGGQGSESITLAPLSPGICARDKKARSKPMQEVLKRLQATGHFQAVYFGDAMLADTPVEEWPVVDCLIAFFSSGFPLEKALRYVRLRRPFCVNNLHSELTLRDRRAFYTKLVRAGIPTPRHIVCSRDGAAQPVVVEAEDYIEINGERLDKPFVEKPVDAEDHGVYIYYPRRLGGGSKRLFRKVANKSSQFYPHINSVRRGGSFIYEEFIMTQGTDIKLYLVGPDYAHAEARKSPVVDGVVQRDAEGKEMRFPILLTPAEKRIARQVCLAFKQNVCGFDMLRTGTQSYVCDVNGWSFVKKSGKYYDDAASILAVIMLRSVAPHRLKVLGPVATRAAHSLRGAGLPPLHAIMGGRFGGPRRRGSASRPRLDRPLSSTSTPETPLPSGEVLRGITAVIRHGDRTPKQKIKMKVSHPALLALLGEHAPSPRSEAKLKSAIALGQVLAVVRALVEEADGRVCAEHSTDGGTGGGLGEEDVEKLRQIRAVLEKGGNFSGINRKVQLKPTKWAAAAPPVEAVVSDCVSALEDCASQPGMAKSSPLALSAAAVVEPGSLPAAPLTPEGGRGRFDTDASRRSSGAWDVGPDNASVLGAQGGLAEGEALGTPEMLQRLRVLSGVPESAVSLPRRPSRAYSRDFSGPRVGAVASKGSSSAFSATTCRWHRDTGGRSQ